MGKSFRHDNEYGRKFKGFQKNSNRDNDVKHQKFNFQPAELVRSNEWSRATKLEKWSGFTVYPKKPFDFL